MNDLRKQFYDNTPQKNEHNISTGGGLISNTPRNT